MLSYKLYYTLLYYTKLYYTVLYCTIQDSKAIVSALHYASVGWRLVG